MLFLRISHDADDSLHSLSCCRLSLYKHLNVIFPQQDSHLIRVLHNSGLNQVKHGLYKFNTVLNTDVAEVGDND